MFLSTKSRRVNSILQHANARFRPTRGSPTQPFNSSQNSALEEDTRQTCRKSPVATTSLVSSPSLWRTTVASSIANLFDQARDADTSSAGDASFLTAGIQVFSRSAIALTDPHANTGDREPILSLSLSRIPTRTGEPFASRRTICARSVLLAWVGEWLWFPDCTRK